MKTTIIVQISSVNAGLPVIAESQMGVELDTTYEQYKTLLVNLTGDNAVELVLKTLDKHQKLVEEQNRTLLPVPELKKVNEGKPNETKTVEVAPVPVQAPANAAGESQPVVGQPIGPPVESPAESTAR